MPLAILLAFEVLLLLMYIIDDPFRVRIDMWLFYSCQIASIIAVTLALAVVVHEESGEADPRIALFPVFVLGIYTFSLLARSSVYVKRWFDVRRMKKKAAKTMNMRERRASAMKTAVKVCRSCKAVNPAANKTCKKCAWAMSPSRSGDAGGGAEDEDDDHIASLNIVHTPVPPSKDPSDVPDGPLAPGWTPHTDASTGHLYFWNAATHETTWARPISPAVNSAGGGGGGNTDGETMAAANVSSPLYGDAAATAAARTHASRALAKMNTRNRHSVELTDMSDMPDLSGDWDNDAEGKGGAVVGEGEEGKKSCDDPWESHVDPVSGATYWMNSVTNVSVWEKPVRTTVPNVPQSPGGRRGGGSRLQPHHSTALTAVTDSRRDTFEI